MWDKNNIARRRPFNHPVVKLYAETRISLITKQLNQSFESMLEVGAGDGYFSSVLVETNQLLVLDSSSEMLAMNPVANKVHSTLKEFAKKGLMFDVVFEANMLHHADDINEAIWEMCSMAKHCVVLIEPNPINPLTLLSALFLPNERNGLLMTKNRIEREFLKNGFTLEKKTDVGFYPANRCPLWLWNCLKKVEGKAPIIGVESIYIFRKRNE